MTAPRTCGYPEDEAKRRVFNHRESFDILTNIAIHREEFIAGLSSVTISVLYYRDSPPISPILDAGRGLSWNDKLAKVEEDVDWTVREGYQRYCRPDDKA